MRKRIVRFIAGYAVLKPGLKRKSLLCRAGVLALQVMPGLPPMPRASAQAQTQKDSDAARLPQMTVASIRPSARNGSCGFSPDGFRCEGISLKGLIRTAYSIDKDYLLSAAPPWTESARYQIYARMDEADAAAFSILHYDQRALTLRPLLEDRFKLKAHWETRDLPVYVLVIAKGGSKLRAPTPDNPANKQREAGEAAIGAGAILMRLNGQADGKAVPTSMLTRLQSPYLDRVILDQTGLTGNYDFSVQLPRWRAGRGDAGITVGGGDQTGSDLSANADPSQPSIFSAVADLGLKLQPRTAPLQVLVIDHVERPSEN